MLGVRVSSYTVAELASRGPPHAFALLLQHIRDGDEPFVTYGSIARLLEKRLNIPRVFPTHIGTVAGTLMNEIEAIDADAPPINALITRPVGIPGTGFANYYNRLWRGEGERHWDKLSRGLKLRAVEEIRAAVRRYPGWDAIYRKLYGASPPRAPRPKVFTEKDGKPPETGRRPGAGESPEHHKLKEWAAANPEKLGLVSTAEQNQASGAE
jgi:hypothetical protein